MWRHFVRQINKWNECENECETLNGECKSILFLCEMSNNALGSFYARGKMQNVRAFYFSVKGKKKKKGWILVREK